MDCKTACLGPNQIRLWPWSLENCTQDLMKHLAKWKSQLQSMNSNPERHRWKDRLAETPALPSTYLRRSKPATFTSTLDQSTWTVTKESLRVLLTCETIWSMLPSVVSIAADSHYVGLHQSFPVCCSIRNYFQQQWATSWSSSLRSAYPWHNELWHSLLFCTSFCRKFWGID